MGMLPVFNYLVMLLFCSRQRQGKCVGLKVKEGLGGLLLSQATYKSQQGTEPDNIGSERNIGKRRNVEHKSLPVEC